VSIEVDARAFVDHPPSMSLQEHRNGARQELTFVVSPPVGLLTSLCRKAFWRGFGHGSEDACVSQLRTRRQLRFNDVTIRFGRPHSLRMQQTDVVAPTIRTSGDAKGMRQRLEVEGDTLN
jgi:hypothetical protein